MEEEGSPIGGGTHVVGGDGVDSSSTAPLSLDASLTLLHFPSQTTPFLLEDSIFGGW